MKNIGLFLCSVTGFFIILGCLFYNSLLIDMDKMKDYVTESNLILEEYIKNEDKVDSDKGEYISRLLTIKKGMEIKINEKKEIIERVRNLIPKNKILIQNKNYALYTMDAYQNEFKRIDEIVKVISGCLPNSQKEDILRKLHLTSFNLPHTFYELKYPQSKKYIFTETEDYIIRNMQGSDIYNELIKVKGEKNVLQRKRYLNY